LNGASSRDSVEPRRIALEGPAERGLARAVAGPHAQLLLAMVGSVCGTLITGALDTSPTVRLVGAVLGAAVPTLISYAGPHAHVRAGVGIAVTAVALFVTYGGFTLFDFRHGPAEDVPPSSSSAGAGRGRWKHRDERGRARH
jgi:hypothetical protein